MAVKRALGLLVVRIHERYGVGGFALTEAATWTSRPAFKVSDPAPPGLLGPVTLRAETKVEISWPFGDIEKRPLSENL
jgi:hypothetical protein